MTTADILRRAPDKPSLRDRHRASQVALVSWMFVVVTMITIGAVWHPGYPDGWLPPFHAHLRIPPLGLVVAAAYGLIAMWWLPRLTGHFTWKRTLLLTSAASAAWAYVLAASDGLSAVAEPLTRSREYLAALPGVGNHPLAWLSSFAVNVDSFPTHVAGHPPLAVLVFWVLAKVGLAGAGWAATLCIAAGASASAALLIVLRELGDESRARAAAPYLALAPFAVTVATSADALFLGVSAWSIAVFAIATRRHSVVLGVLGGALLGAAAFLSYGLLVIGALVVAVFALRWSSRAALGGAIGVLAVVSAFALGGFWWLDGVRATSVRWDAGTGSNRPYDFTVIGNLAVLAVLVGPASAAALGWVRDRATVVIAGAALAAVLALDVSGLTRGEVERIWLPLAPWLVLVCAAIPTRFTRRALAAQVVVALAVQGLLVMAW